MPIGEALESIRKQIEPIHYDLVYSPEILQGMPMLNVDLAPQTELDSTLAVLFAGLDIQFTIKKRVVNIYRDLNHPFIYLPVKVRVTNKMNEVLAGATIYLRSAHASYSTDTAGMLSYAPRSFITTAAISYAGYLSKTKLLSNKIPVNDVVLDTAPSELSEVQVIGYGTTTQQIATGSVSKVKGEDLVKHTNTNVLEGLEGRVPGVFIRHYNGIPGSSFELEIRGQHSIQQGNFPLIVVNGIPLADNGGMLSTVGLGSAQRPYGASNLNCIPPEMIKSIEVLRGPDATAIYGSRASNGVMIITLQEGMPHPLRIDVNVDAGGSRTVKISPMLNTMQFLGLRREAVLNDRLMADGSSLPEQADWGSTRNTNFKKTVMGGTGQQYHGNLELGWDTKNTTFLVAGSTLEQTSVFPGRTYDDRQSLYGQVQSKSCKRKLRWNVAGLYSYEGNRLPIEDYGRYMALAPNAPPFFTAEGQPQWMYNGLSFANIPAKENNVYQSKMSTWFVHLQLRYDLPVPGLSLENDLGYNGIVAGEVSRQPVSGEDPATIPTPIDETNTARNTYNSELAEQLVKYSNMVGPGHVNAVAGITWQGQNSHLALIPTEAYSSHQEYYRYDAAFGRVTYNIQDRYIVTGSWRRDGSSRFAPAERLADFWSAGAAWIPSATPYIKLRGSYGTTGNDETGELGFTEIYNPILAARGYQGLSSVAPDSLYNPYIHYEVSHMVEAALELGLLKNRLFLSAIGYYSRSSNQLVTKSLASQAGRPGVLANQPIAVVNEGLEFQVRGNVLNGGLGWTSVFNLTLPRNRLARYPGLATSFYATILKKGRPVDAVKAFHFIGIDPQTGAYAFEGETGAGVQGLGANELVASPAPEQRCYGGWVNQLRYKRFELEILLQFVAQDGENPLGILYQQDPPGMQAASQLSNGPVEWLDHWQYPGEHARLQVVSSVPGSRANQALSAYVQSDANIIDASYIRLSDLSLSYQLPKKALGVLRGCEVYVRAQNLWTYSRFPVTDPETQDPTVLPVMRTLIVGIRLNL
jgi:TonB-linked SusC/RagA family outer membrane protein